MGWFVVNVLVPLGGPMIFMLLSRAIPLPATAAARTKLLYLVQDGQLGWVAMSFGTSSAYDAYAHVTKYGEKSASWAGTVLSIAIALIVISAHLAAVGALFPVDSKLPVPATRKEWLKRYANFIGTALATLITSAIYAVVHYELAPTA